MNEAPPLERQGFSRSALQERTMQETIISERWKMAVGRYGYEVSTLGRVRSVDRITCDRLGRLSRRVGKVLAPALNTNGYPYVALSGKSVVIHRLVAIAFLLNPNNLPQVNHLNGNKTDNRIENLEWCDGSRNMLHAFQIGARKSSQHSKLSDEDVKNIRAMSGSHTSIARKYGVSQVCITNIINHKRWKLLSA